MEKTRLLDKDDALGREVAECKNENEALNRLIAEALENFDASNPAHRKPLKPCICLVVVLYQGRLNGAYIGRTKSALPHP